MLSTLGILYALLLVAGCAWQRKMIYFPTRLAPEEAARIARENGQVPWLNATGAVIGWVTPAPGAATASVLILHGNGGCAVQRGYFTEPLHEVAGLTCYVLEYPGYGGRGGAPSEDSWLRAAEEAFALLPKAQPIFLVSESLGTGAAAHLARQFSTNIAGLVLFVPYDSLPRLAQSKAPILLPYWFLVDRYEPAQWLRDYRGPARFVLAENDNIIPPRFGRRLFDSYSGPKQIEVIAGAGHNDVTSQPVEWWRATIDWLKNPKPVSNP